MNIEKNDEKLQTFIRVCVAATVQAVAAVATDEDVERVRRQLETAYSQAPVAGANGGEQSMHLGLPSATCTSHALCLTSHT